MGFVAGRRKVQNEAKEAKKKKGMRTLVSERKPIA